MKILRGYGLGKLTGAPGTPFNRTARYTHIPPWSKSVPKDKEKQGESNSQGILRRLLAAALRRI